MIAFGTLSQEIGSKSQEIMRDDHHFKNGDMTVYNWPLPSW
jgi:hypothetical protein